MSFALWRARAALPAQGALLIVVLGVAPNARSQVAASATFTTNYLYRGLSLSDGRPALDLSILYDDKSGFYAGGSLIGEATQRRGVQGLGHLEYLGYAYRMRGGSTLDVGVNNLHYRSYDYGYPSGEEDATEVYAGWVKGLVNYYVHYSPNYFAPGAHVLYGEVNGAVRLPRPWRLFGHVGVLTPLGGGYDHKERYDVRAGIAASFKHAEAQLSWTAAAPARAYLDPSSQGRGVVAFALTWDF